MGVNYLDDFVPGQRFASNDRVHMDEKQIKVFARAFDPQPFHLDEVAARTGRKRLAYHIGH